MTTLLLTACLSCQRVLKNGTCTAFPEGIPDDILSGMADHQTSRDGEPTYLADPEKDVNARAWKTKAAHLEEAADALTSSEVFHQPGKHNQKTHGRHGSGTWTTVDISEIEEKNFQMMREIANPSVPDSKIREMAKVAPGTRIWRFDGGKVGLSVQANTQINDANLKHTQEVLADLHHKYPIKGGEVDVSISTPDAFNRTTIGETYPSMRVVRINSVAYEPSFKYANSNMHPAVMYRDPAGGTIAHEWGHLVAMDHESSAQTVMYHRNFGGLSGYAQSTYKPEEGFADCFADFYMGDNSLGATPAYATTFGWKERA